MAEIKLQKRYKYAGDIMPKLLDIGFDLETANDFLNSIPDADVAPRAEIIEEYRKKVYAKMEKYTVFGREYIQRIMREVEKEMNGGEQYAKKP